MTTVIFLGTPNFAVPILEGLLAKGYDIKAVVTQPDKKVGRKQVLTASPVKKAALEHGLSVYQPAHLSKSAELETLMAMSPDLIITAAYGQFLPTKFLRAARIAAVNVHGSLLPKYRGGAPIQYALLNGDTQTGITIMEMVKEMDAGDIYAQAALQIMPEDNAGSLFEKLSILGRDLLLDTLPKIITHAIEKQPQDPAGVVFSPNISKAQERITLDLTAEEANNKIRALNPDPGAYLMLNGQLLKIWQAKVADEGTSLPAGSLVSNKNRFALSFAENSVLELLEVQPNGKKRMSIKDFLNGQGKNFVPGEQIVSED